MKRIIIFIMAISFITVACEDIADLNIDPKNPTSVEPDALFTYGQYNIAKQMVDIDYNRNVGRIWANYYTQTTYINEANYDASDRDVGGTMWDNVYTECLYELRQAQEILEATDVAAALEPVKQNKLALITIMQVYAWQYLVDSFGDIPYTDALDVNVIVPVYDDAATIYASLATDLQAAIAALDPGFDSFPSNVDLMYGGDVAKWEMFANSMLLNMGLRLADVDNAKASTLVSAAVTGGVFTSNADNALFYFSATQPYTNPIYDYFNVDNRASDFVVTDFFITMLQDLSDPRIDMYLDQNLAVYTGGEYGAAGNAYESLTHPSVNITDVADLPGTLMDFSAVSFGLAEAVERGYIAGSAATYYDAAIRASFDFWGLATTDADTYLAQPSVAYATATGTFKEKIGIQKYIGLYNQGHEAWTEARRLDSPTLLTAINSGTPNPKRMIYPVEEVLINSTNYKSASTKIGGDETSTPIFWDVN